MKYLVDTDIVSYLMKGRSSKLNMMVSQNADEFAISSITYHELWRGLMETKSESTELLLTDFLKSVNVISFEQSDARESGRIYAELKSQGKPIGYNDTLIAGQALANQLVLVTNNTKHFSKVKGLQLENWMK